MFDHLHNNKTALLKDTEKKHPNSLLTNALMDRKRLSFRFLVWFTESTALQTFIARMPVKTSFCYLVWDNGNIAF